MGCCLCRPETDVEQDPSVVSYAEVGDIIITRGSVRLLGLGRYSRGLMYIQGDSFYYVTKCGSKLCCCKCFRYSFKLSDIDQVDMLNRSSLNLPPGLRISVHPDITILAGMPDAATFARPLSKMSNTTTTYEKHAQSFELLPKATGRPSRRQKEGWK